MAEGNEESTLLTSSPEEDLDDIVIPVRRGSANARRASNEDGAAGQTKKGQRRDSDRRASNLYQMLYPAFEAVDEDRRRTFAGDICVWLAPLFVLGLTLGSTFFLTFNNHTVFGGIVLNATLSVTFISGILTVRMRKGWTFLLFGAMGMLSGLVLLSAAGYLSKYITMGSIGVIDSTTITLRQTMERYENLLIEKATSTAQSTVENEAGAQAAARAMEVKLHPMEEYGEFWLWKVEDTFNGEQSVWGGANDYRTWREREYQRLPPNPPVVDQYLMEVSMSYVNVGALKSFTGRTYKVWWSKFPFTRWPVSYDECQLDAMMYRKPGLPTTQMKRDSLEDWKNAVLKKGLDKDTFYECVYYLDNTSQVLVYQGFYFIWILVLAFFILFALCSIPCYCIPSVVSYRAFGRVAGGFKDKTKRRKHVEDVVKKQIDQEEVEQALKRDHGSSYAMSDEP